MLEMTRVVKGRDVFVLNSLLLFQFLSNLFYIFQKYAERQAGRPEIRDGMEFVPQPDDRTSVCSCHRKKPSKEEL